MPWIANFDRTACQIAPAFPEKRSIYTALSLGVCLALMSWRIAMDAKRRAMRNPALRRKSMKLLKDITQMLREILSSGDEEGLRQLEKTIRALEQSRHKPGSHAIH
jgi:hypothetical protein